MSVVINMPTFKYKHVFSTTLICDHTRPDYALMLTRQLYNVTVQAKCLFLQTIPHIHCMHKQQSQLKGTKVMLTEHIS